MWGTNRPRPVAGTRAPPIVSTISRLETRLTILQEPGAAAALAHGKNDLKEARFIDSDVYLQSGHCQG